ncbi:MAG: hypothetical protein HQK88_15525 [Nitrospirae bacterium]|nr:hypothetical protein [Nitrospirota bacterium]MBF0536164.1 hypothetical protein [Nitrospirota bacterium]MBF0618211.1 hypothetical protein [Nitrospirota bacterium]
MNIKLLKELMLRGYVLEILKADHEQFINEEELRARLYLFGYALLSDDLKIQLRYLENKGYVKRNEKFNGQICEVGITADGDDLLNGIIKDDGVFIPRGRHNG